MQRHLLMSVLLMIATLLAAAEPLVSIDRSPRSPRRHRSAHIVSNKSLSFFRNNKGRLAWPVVAGHVTMDFGLHNYQNQETRYNNPFLTIGAKAGSEIRSVFEGVVTQIIRIDDNQAVIIRHGEYYTCYGNLSDIKIVRGDTVKTGQPIGLLAEKSEGTGELEFTIMMAHTVNRYVNLNPRVWLASK